MNTRFVICFFEPSNIDIIYDWMATELPLLLFVPDSIALVASRHVKIRPLPSYNVMSFYSESLEKLPYERNLTKDTREHLWNMHLKIHCLHEATTDDTSYYALMDAHCLTLFHDRINTIQRLKRAAYCSHLFLRERDKMYVPGCWGKCEKIDDEFANHVNWRFLGCFMWGSVNAIAEFYELYCKHFSEFIESQQGVLSWEVNYMAYLETHCQWQPVHYYADHNDTMVLPRLFGYECLLEKNALMRPLDLRFRVPKFQPMSTSVVDYLGVLYCNTRYVNYWIYDNGVYGFFDYTNVIQTRNVCWHAGFTGIIMEEETPLWPIQQGTFSEGLEDMRLYVSGGMIHFIATSVNWSYNDKIRMIRGIYDVERFCCRDLQYIEPPYDTQCEKNWAHIELPDGSDGFVYKWYPLEIGKIVCENDETPYLGKLEIVIRKPMTREFEHMKGSTVFTRYGENGLMAVIHFSEELKPREYYHRVVILNRETFEVEKMSDIFCFEKPRIEFCIGFRVLEYGEKLGFWISKMDRDPMYVEMDLKHIM